MPNDFYTPTGNPIDNSNIVSPDMRAEFAAINAGFNKLPALTGNANKLVVINSSGTGMDVTVAPAGLTSINKIALTQPATGATFTLLDGKTLTVSNTLTLAGTDGTTMTFPATSATLARIDAAQTFVGTQTFSGLINANLGLTVAGAAFNSRGITDNATAKALTLSGSGANSITIANSATNPTLGTTAGNLLLSPAGGAGDVVTSNGANAIYFKAINTANAIGAFFGVEAVGNAYAWNRNASNSNFYIGNGNTGNTTGVLIIQAAGVEQVRVTPTAAADQYITLTGGVSGSATNTKIGSSGGQLTLGTGAALATSATAGYVCIPTCAGTPTGVPTGAGAGNLPLIYDTTNNKLYAYNGAWKATAALT